MICALLAPALDRDLNGPALVVAVPGQTLVTSELVRLATISILGIDEVYSWADRVIVVDRPVIGNTVIGQQVD